ncbi:MAG: LAGLIDADG family homing endonuclease [Psychrobacillus sp.]
MSKVLTKEEIILLYYSGVSVEDIVKQSHYKARSTIYRILGKYGIYPNRNPKIELSSVEVKEIISIYKSSPKISAVKIGKMYGISGDSVLQILRENFVSIRRQPRKHIINEAYFDSLNPSVMYIVALIQTDGTIHKDLLGFSIIQKDYELLKKVAVEMGADEHIIYEYGNGVPSLIVRSKKMVRSLMDNYKLHPNKSKTLEMPKVPEVLIPSMLRALFDGDGHFSKREAGFVTASESFALSFYDILQEYGLEPKLNLEKPNQTWLFRVYVRGIDKLKMLNDILYSDGSTLYREDKKSRLSNAYKKGDIDE